LTPVDGTTAPLAFRWRGRRYVVASVLAHWVETGAWWRRPAVEVGPADAERRLWRVEVCRGGQTGVVDLCLEVDRPTEQASDLDRWSLYAIHD
jgi:hypothetical protein